MSRVPSARQYEQTVQDREYGPPAARIYTTGASGGIVVIAILLFSLVVMYLVSRNGTSAWVGIVGTTIFFTVAVPIGLMASNGSFAIMHGTWQEQRTLRVLHQQRVSVPELPQLEYREPVVPALPQLPEAAGPSFVPAVAPLEENLRFMAATFVNDLFDLQTGEFNKHVSPNTKQIQRKAPNKEVERYLEELGITYRGKGGQWYWNTDRYPVRIEAVRAINKGRPGSLEGRGGSKGRVGLTAGVQL